MARRDWKVGRIEQVYPGNDGLVRVVDVKVRGRTLRRPISVISPLEMQRDKHYELTYVHVGYLLTDYLYFVELRISRRISLNSGGGNVPL